MRTSFELKVLAATLLEAKLEVYKHVVAFAGCDPKDVPEKVELEFKVKTLDVSEDSNKSVWSKSTEMYEITVFGVLKQSVLKPT